MELAAINELNPSVHHHVLAIGFGPGVGIRELDGLLPQGTVAGIDPSATMVHLAERRNRHAIECGRVILRQAGAEAIPWPDRAFDGIVAVNSIQFWQPLDAAIGEVARILRPSGAFVAVTHDWAIEKKSLITEWVEMLFELLLTHGFSSSSHRTESFRSGTGLVVRASV
jgi:ubiquinone/menaquinone biosynthesis C-methylase UbiE